MGRKNDNTYKRWTIEEKQLLYELYPITSNKILAMKIGKTIDCIQHKATSLQLKKLNYIPKKMWTPEEITKLKELYSDMRNEDIAKLFGVIWTQVRSKARELKLYKSTEHRSNMIGKRNKMVGRDLTFEVVREIALKYRTRGEFQLKDWSAYATARRANYLDKICEHMAVVNYSIPQIILRKIVDGLLNSQSDYSTRRIIKPYEIDVYYPEFKLAFEYNGKGWHHNEDVIERDKIKLVKFKEMGITPVIIIENNRNYEEDVKSQLIDKLSIINNITNKNITKEDILNFDIGNPYELVHNKQDLLNIAKKYTSFKEFRLTEVTAYNKLSDLKLIDIATEHMDDRVKEWTLESLSLVISKYTHLKPLIQNDVGAYCHIKKNKLSHLIEHLIDGRTLPRKLKYSIEEIKSKISEYTIITQFRRENMQMYDFIICHKLNNLMDSLECKNRKLNYTIDQIKSKIAEYTIKVNFRKENTQMYTYIKGKKLTHLLSNLKSRCRY